MLNCRQVQVETGQMSGEFLLRYTEPPKFSGHRVYALRRAESGDRTSVLGQYRGDNDHLRGLHRHGKK